MLRLFTGLLLGMASLAYPPCVVAQGGAFLIMADSIGGEAAAWGDYDADGDLDVALPFHTGLFRNDGDSTLASDAGIIHLTRYRSVFRTEPPLEGDRRPESPMRNQEGAALAWGDYDNDGDLDLAVTGTAGLDIYTNLGTDALLSGPATYDGLYHGDLAWGDYDNDGDLDLALSGIDEAGQYAAWLFENDGAGGFTRRDAGLTGLAYGSVEWGDYDGDGDLDLLVAGNARPQGFETKVYRNDGGAFADTGLAVRPALLWATAAWADYDADGDLDLAVNGGRLCVFLLCGVVFLYRNDGGAFTRTDYYLPGGYQGDLDWGDYDADGDLDLVVLGGTFPGDTRLLQVLRNDGGPFTVDDTFVGIRPGHLEWGDYDGDGDLDFLAVGRQRDLLPRHGFRNELGGNVPPSAPTGLRATRDGDAVTFSWEPATDDHTPAPGLTYNLRVGRSQDQLDVVSPMARPDGYRLLSAPGNAGHNLNWTIRGLSEGAYFWTVQAVDGSLQGGAFATEQVFATDPDDRTPPAPPTAFAAVNNDGQVVLTWQPSPSDDVVRHRIYRATAPGANVLYATLPGATTGFLDEDVTVGTTYYYRLTAEDATGNQSTPTPEVGVTPLHTFAPAGLGLPGLAASDAAWGDYDGDGDLDLVLSGATAVLAPVTRIYRNDGAAGLTDIDAGLRPVHQGEAAWGDYDGDGDLDLALVGNQVGAGTHGFAGIYRNDGQDRFLLVTDELLRDTEGQGVNNSAVAWADVEGDGDLDLTLAGRVFGDELTLIFRNEANGSFVRLTPQQLGADLLDISDGSIDWADYDGDGDPDLLLAGRSGLTVRTQLFENDGGRLQAVASGLPDVGFGEARWGDYDGDGDPDVALTGTIGPARGLQVYRNDGGRFDRVLALDGPFSGDLAWGDYDADGDLDLAVAAMDPGTVQVFVNEAGQFEPIRVMTSLRNGDLAWGDYDADGYPDLVITGDTGDGNLADVFLNNATFLDPPSPATREGRPVRLRQSLRDPSYGN